MTEKEYRRLKAMIEDRYKADLSALERVWALQGGSPTPSGNFLRRSDRSTITEAVRKAVANLQEQFTAKDILTSIHESQPDAKLNAVSTVLKRLALEGAIEVVKKGTGTALSVYGRPGSREPDHSTDAAGVVAMK